MDGTSMILLTGIGLNGFYTSGRRLTGNIEDNDNQRMERKYVDK